MSEPAWAPPGEGWVADEECGFVALIGPVWQRSEGAGMTYGLRVEPKHMNRDGSLHGGMFLALFDHALGMAAYAHGGVERLVTMQLGTQFMGGAKVGDFLELTAEVVKQTGSYMFMRGECRGAAKLLATSEGIWKKFHRRAHGAAGGG